jgi:mediator of RNA polymerase II transcription subunit 16
MANEMPLLLDNAMPVDLDDVEDLFGDGVGLALPVRQNSLQLETRLEELKFGGSRQ